MTINSTLGPNGYEVSIPAPVSGGGVFLPDASGDATGVTDSANIEAAIAAAVLGNGIVNVPAAEYILKRDIQMDSGLHIRLAQGAVLRLADSFTIAVTANSTDTVTTTADTSLVDIQMHVLDASADLAAGNALGCTPGNLRVIAKTATTIQFSAALTASGAQTLRFYVRGNVITADRAVGWSLTCPGGWAYLDGNRSHVYPYGIGGNDSVGNALRIRSCSEWDVDGICGRNTRYHGLICVGKNFDHRIGRFRGTNNGYRALHYHSENLDGVTNGEVSRGHLEYVEADTTGVLAFQSQGNEENNSGVFLALDNVAGMTVGTIRSREAYGAAVMLSGTISALSASNNNSVGAIYSENSAITLGLYRELRNFSVGTVVGRGKYVQLTGCATLDAADLTWYYMPSSGTQSTYAVRRVQLPVGSIAANNIRAGHRLYMSSGTTGMAGGGLQVMKADIGTGAGGTDIIWLFRDGGTANPYTTVASGFAVHIWTCRGTAFLMDEASTKQIKGIKIGSMTLEWAGRSAIGMTASTSECRYRDISIGSLTIDGVAASCNWASVAGLTVGHYMKKNMTNGLPDAGATQTGGVSNLFSNCANVTLPAVYGDFTMPTGADNNVQWRFDANCRNIAMTPRGLHPSASAATIDSVIPSGAAANSAGFAGPLVLTDPRLKTGAQIAVSATGIVRVDATACIINRPVDTP